MQNVFRQLNQILIDYADIWRVSPFSTPKPHWLAQYPKLQDWLLTLSGEDVDRLQGDDNLLCQQIAPYFPVAQEIYSLIQLPLSENKTSVERSYAWQRDVPGRKVEQIEAFAAATGEVTNPLIEWCSGKLHLGRYLAEQYKVPVIGLEINANLVEQANHLALRMNSDARVERCDVLSAEARHKLNDQQHAIALHACGGLHVSLLSACIDKRVKRITLSPCCYHRFNKSATYQPLSTTAKASKLQLDEEDLRSAVRQSNTAAERERIKRKQLQRWRLGFDLLQRDVRGVDEYLPVPSLSVKMLDLDFRHFCLHVAKVKQIILPGGVNFEHYEAKGDQRFFEYSRYELVRMTFRRALECWLVLDRVMYLEERGYSCKLVQFCPASLTPRNFLIDACRVNRFG
ncbi:methyltransferase [Alkalimarinus sediminis]|uniref:SAM-dependent methyltransferase n=1 Tax=Alkalimarinus sediminis TaxID=1632866 RepID=A0A9E8KPQ6_9ALTE|nr:methyltransferase [Alkalimarinus sediminis]UZW74974.1 SAM-dependent methyltransferase [Alkalimarinus sediminis]